MIAYFYEKNDRILNVLLSFNVLSWIFHSLLRIDILLPIVSFYNLCFTLLADYVLYSVYFYLRDIISRAGTLKAVSLKAEAGTGYKIIYSKGCQLEGGR